MYGGGLLGVMNCSHEEYIMMSRGVVSLDSFLSSVVSGRSKVALRVSWEVRREDLGPSLSPFGNMAMMMLVGWICSA